LGDVHTGQYVQAAEVGTRLAYGPDEFTDRMELWTTGVIDHLDHLSRFATIEHVALVGLGDYIENAQMREGSARYTHETTAEAVVRFCEELLNALERLITRHPHYRYSLDFKNGNHDRIGRKGEGHPWESYGTIIAAYVKRGMADYTNLTVTGHTEDATLFQLGRNQILVTHGQQAQGGTLPFAAIERLSERYAGFTRNQHQFLVVGHYHHGARWTANNGVECILNPAFAETSSFSSGLGLASPAGQKVLTFLAEGGLYCDHTIPLSDAPIASITPHIRGAAA
jgi:predicted phosphodiesterase